MTRFTFCISESCLSATLSFSFHLVILKLLLEQLFWLHANLVRYFPILDATEVAISVLWASFQLSMSWLGCDRLFRGVEKKKGHAWGRVVVGLLSEGRISERIRRVKGGWEVGRAVPWVALKGWSKVHSLWKMVFF